MGNTSLFISYGICGVGLGHLIRSLPIINILNKKYNLKIYTHDLPFKILSKSNFNLKRINGLKFYSKKGKLDVKKTFVKNIPLIFQKIDKSDLIISDSEIVTFLNSVFRNTKLITIYNLFFTEKNIHLLGDKKKELKYQIKFIKYANKIVRKKSLIVINPSFEFKKEGKIIFTDPLFYLPKTKVIKDFIVVNFNDDFYGFNFYSKMIKNFNKSKEKFVIFTKKVKREKKIKNVILKPINRKEYLKYVRGAKAFFGNAGLTKISENLYFGVPMVLKPIDNHIEQIINAKYIEKKEWGKIAEHFDDKDIEYFRENIPNLRLGNKKIVKIIEEVISKNFL